jgi:HK97 family phage major capsid protein
VWIINQDIEPELFELSIPVGTGGIPVYQPANGLADAPFSTLMGRPVIPVEHCATLGTVNDIALVDFSQYLMIDKGTPKQDVSIHVRFINDESAFRIVYRVDGQPIWNSALTPKKGSNTLSPYITLATRS